MSGTAVSSTSPPTLVLLPGLDGTGALSAPFQEVCPHPTQVVRYPANHLPDDDALLEQVRAELPDEACILTLCLTRASACADHQRA